MKSNKYKTIVFVGCLLGVSCIGYMITDLVLRYAYVVTLYTFLMIVQIIFIKHSPKMKLDSWRLFRIEIINSGAVLGGIVYLIGIQSIKWELINSQTQLTFSNYYYMYGMLALLIALGRFKMTKKANKV